MGFDNKHDWIPMVNIKLKDNMIHHWLDDSEASHRSQNLSLEQYIRHLLPSRFLIGPGPEPTT